MSRCVQCALQCVCMCCIQPLLYVCLHLCDKEKSCVVQGAALHSLELFYSQPVHWHLWCMFICACVIEQGSIRWKTKACQLETFRLYQIRMHTQHTPTITHPRFVLGYFFCLSKTFNIQSILSGSIIEFEINNSTDN